jgi:spermidine/putrescine ABC transporter ATP-binding subunit
MSDGDFIHVARVSKKFAGVTAVDDAELAIARGEFFSLLGPSGCGKTTLLRMIAGFEYPSEGRILIEGQDVTDMPPNKRPTNMVFQSYAIFPHLNVFDNIAYGLRKERLSRGELKRRVNEALAMIKLEGFGARRGHELSGGQRQRVALARALVRRPKVLLLDEPLGALDKRLREAMQVELRQLQRSVGITFVFVTHDQEEALSMSDRIAVMSGGAILQVAAPRDLYEHPNCREVADFIGEMNFFNGVVASDGTIEAPPLGRVRATASLLAGTKVHVALRPEKISLMPMASEGAVECIVRSASYLGERSHYGVFVAGRAERIAVAVQNSPSATDFAAGQTAYMSWPHDAVVVLTE